MLNNNLPIPNNNHLQLFNFSEANQKVRTFLDDNQDIWFVAKDIASILEYDQTANMLKRLDDDEKSVLSSSKMDELSITLDKKEFGYNDIVIINESGLYNSIIGSKKPIAKKFKKWITSEVIPSIRKKGYHIQQNLSGIDYANMMVEIAQKLQYAEQEKIRLAEENKLMLPKVEAYGDFLDTKNCMTMSEVAKSIYNENRKIGRNKLFSMLRDNKILRENNEPYQRFIDEGFFKMRQVIIDHSDYTETKSQTLVTKKGAEYIRKIVNKNTSK